MKIWDSTREIPEPYRFIAVLWLTFLIAGVATIICFALIDPAEVAVCLHLPETSNTAMYTIGFLSFWALSAISGLLTTYFLNPEN